VICDLGIPTLYSQRKYVVLISLMRAISIREPAGEIKVTRTNRCRGHVLIGVRWGFRSSVRWVKLEF
jgi:hypothetical protein